MIVSRCFNNVITRIATELEEDNIRRRRAAGGFTWDKIFRPISRFEEKRTELIKLGKNSGYNEEFKYLHKINH